MIVRLSSTRQRAGPSGRTSLSMTRPRIITSTVGSHSLGGLKKDLLFLRDRLRTDRKVSRGRLTRLRNDLERKKRSLKERKKETLSFKKLGEVKNSVVVGRKYRRSGEPKLLLPGRKRFARQHLGEGSNWLVSRPEKESGHRLMGSTRGNGRAGDKLTSPPRKRR